MTLFPRDGYEVFSEFLEIETAEGQTVWIARSALAKFSEHRPASGPSAG